MVEKNKLGWTFMTDGFEGIPYLKCPYCGRKVSGKTVIFAPISLENCPECGIDLHFDNVTEDNWLYISSYYGDDE